MNGNGNGNGEAMKVVYTVIDRGAGKSHWTRVGVGFVNRDGSINLKLDAVPTNGTLQVRDWEEREWGQRPSDGAPRRAPAGPPPGSARNPGSGGLA